MTLSCILAEILLLSRLDVKDADEVGITESGELLMTTSLGEIKEKAPLKLCRWPRKYQSRFKQNEDGTIGFEVGTAPRRYIDYEPVGDLVHLLRRYWRRKCFGPYPGCCRHCLPLRCLHFCHRYCDARRLPDGNRSYTG